MARLVRRYIRNEGINFINEEAPSTRLREGDGHDHQLESDGRSDEHQP